MKKLKLVVLAVAVACGLSIYVQATETDSVPVRTFVQTGDLLAAKASLKKCFTTKGGIDVRVLDQVCPSKAGLEREVADMTQKLGAKRELLEGFTFVFTKHVIMRHLGDSNMRWLAGVTYHGGSENVKFIVVTTHDSHFCSIVSTTRHEIGHAAFFAVDMSSQWLDEPDPTPCTDDDGSELRRIVMTPGEKLPPGPIRDKFEAR